MKQSANERACNRNKPAPTLVPSTALILCADAMADGAAKYGPYNWRTGSIPLMKYLDKIQRHIVAYTDGEERAGDSKIHHLAHAMADLAIVLDAGCHGTLVDDRPPKGKAGALITRMGKR
jgi:hypothetical protein